MTFCHECGKQVVPPSAKFCRNCGASQYEVTQLPIITAATPFPESVREPLSVSGNTCILPQYRQLNFTPQAPIEPIIPNVCKSCSSPITPDEKYCGICGASSDSNAKPPSQPPLLQIDTSQSSQIPPPATMKVCQSCGNPLSGTELFCGICGKPLQSTSPGMSASQQATINTCSNCGKPFRATTRFCGTCGMAVGLK